MAKERRKRPEPSPDPVEESASTSMPDDGFVRGSAKSELKPTGSMGMTLWLYSPARVMLLTEPTRKLADVAQLRKMANRTVESVEAVLHLATRRIFFYPADEKVTDGYPVSYRSEGKHAEFNLRTLLQPHGLEVTRGWREKYEVVLDGDSPFGPALVFQLSTNPVREQVGRGKTAIIEEEGAAPTPKKEAKKVAKKESKKEPKNSAPAKTDQGEQATKTSAPTPQAIPPAPETKE